MAAFDSIFHRLQKADTDTFPMVGEDHPVRFKARTFAHIMQANKAAPFPVIAIRNEDFAKIHSRYMEEMGLSEFIGKQKGGFENIDLVAFHGLMNEALADTPLPAPQFGIELKTARITIGFAFQVAESEGHATPLLRETKSISMLTFIQSADAPVKIEHMEIAYKHGAAQQFGVANLAEGGKMSAAAIDAQSEDYIGTVPALLVFLNVLARDPEWLRANVTAMDKANRLRKARGKGHFSDIRHVTVDAEKLRRVETQFVENLKEAVTQRGGYTVDGLVLVGAYDRANGTHVEAYARCVVEEIRQTATELLRRGYARDETAWPKLAELVHDFGATRTQAHYGQSPITAVRLTQG